MQLRSKVINEINKKISYKRDQEVVRNIPHSNSKPLRPNSKEQYCKGNDNAKSKPQSSFSTVSFHCKHIHSTTLYILELLWGNLNSLRSLGFCMVYVWILQPVRANSHKLLKLHENSKQKDWVFNFWKPMQVILGLYRFCHFYDLASMQDYLKMDVFAENIINWHVLLCLILSNNFLDH